MHPFLPTVVLALVPAWGHSGQVAFMDRAAQADLILEDLSGGPKKTALLETLGHGAA